MRGLGRCLVGVTMMVLVAGFVAVPAFAAPPSNDTEAGAIEVGSLPFTHSMDTSGAGADGPRFCANRASVFYSFTADAAVRVQFDLIGSEYDTTLAVYTRTAAGRVHSVTCNDDRFALAAGVRFRAEAGVRYFLMVGECCSNRGSGGGPLVLTADEVSDIDLTYSVAVTGGTTDPATGLAVVFGTVACNERSIVYREGTLRQVRQTIFVARGYFFFSVMCTPGILVQWSSEVDTETGIAFGPGSAVLTSNYEQASDGWRDSSSTDDVPDATVALQ